MTGDDNAQRERLRRTFDQAALDYQEARPEYPDASYRSLISLADLRPEADPLCEIGPGPGKVTLPLARRGFALTGVELGAALAARAGRTGPGFRG